MAVPTVSLIQRWIEKWASNNSAHLFLKILCLSLLPEGGRIVKSNQSQALPSLL